MKKFRSIIAVLVLLVAQVSPFVVAALTVATPVTALGNTEWKFVKADVAVLVTLALKEPAVRAAVLKKLRGFLLNPKYGKVALKWAEEAVAEFVAKAPAAAERGKQLLQELEALSPEGHGVNLGDAEIANDIGLLRQAAKTAGNFNMGSETAADAMRLGQSWVGDGYTVASDGTTLVSKDGLRQFRPPSSKNSVYATTGAQANFQWRSSPSGAWMGNGHLNITP